MALDQIKVEIITSRFGKMLEDFASINPEIEFRTIVRAVAVRVIAGALRRTKMAQAEAIRRRWADQEWITFDGKKYKLSWYLRNDVLWHQIEEFSLKALWLRQAARGLSKQSWLHQAQQLGENLSVPAQVTAANHAGRQYPGNVSHRETGAGTAYALTILNNSPIVQKAGGRDALAFAMAGETRFFYTSLEKGAFRSAASRAAKYPGVYVSPTAAAA